MRAIGIDTAAWAFDISAPYTTRFIKLIYAHELTT
jgi:hypothetical protein